MNRTVNYGFSSLNTSINNIAGIKYTEIIFFFSQGDTTSHNAEKGINNRDYSPTQR